MAFFLLIGVGAVIVFVTLGIVLTVIGLLLLFGLISIGILSASIIVGLNKKSFAKGFKTFLVSSSIIGALIICSFSFYVLNKVVHWWTTGTAASIGLIVGLISGITFGLTAFYVIQRLTTYLKAQLKLSSF
jgi:hypothetical protein